MYDSVRVHVAYTSSAIALATYGPIMPGIVPAVLVSPMSTPP